LSPRERERGGYAIVVWLFLCVAALFAAGGIKGAEPGVSFAFHNPSSENVWCYWLYRVSDRRGEGWEYAPQIGKWVFPVAGGELRPGKTNEVPGGYSTGNYTIGWRMRDSAIPTRWRMITIRPGTSMVVFTPFKIRAYLGV